MVVLSVLCAAPSDCGGGGSGIPTNSYVIPDQTTMNLTAANVDQILKQAANEASGRGAPAVVAVVDRVGNVLAVATTPNVGLTTAPTCITITSNRGVATGLEDRTKVPACPNAGAVPATLAAVAKAITGAFLSSGGNAFTTRTASQIVQEHFNPGVRGTPGGPLFGVQFSQLPCSDFNQPLGGPVPGPQRSPLGLSADPGGLPIYVQGVLVGGIGVVSQPTSGQPPVYSLDLNVFDFDQNTAAGDNNEIIALAAVTGFGAPEPIQAQNISAGGVTLRYIDATTGDFARPVALGAYTLVPAAGALAAFWNGTLNNGTFWGRAPVLGSPFVTGVSGVFPDAPPTGTGNYPGVAAWAFLDPTTGVERAPRDSPEVGFAQKILAAEARQIVIDGLQVAFATRGQIRIPTNSNAEVSVTVVDRNGNVLAQARTPDAPVFGADVSIQKARSVVYFSRTGLGSAFNDISNISNLAAPVKPSTLGLGAPYTGTFADYANAVSLGGPSFNSGVAFSDRALGDLARPFYPDGIDGTSPGPLSLPFANWSPFSDGLQLDLIIFDIANYGLAPNPPPPAGCGAGGAAPGVSTRALAGGAANAGLPTSGGVAPDNRTPLADGLQIFPGGEPLYRNGVLVGAVGVSGDGVEQDDMVSFLAMQNLNGLDSLGNAASNIRADQLSPGGAPLSYIICPFAPFLDNRVQNAC
jgi:uncharacterized protein GlcG (DUF336 family)